MCAYRCWDDEGDRGPPTQMQVLWRRDDSWGHMSWGYSLRLLHMARLTETVLYWEEWRGKTGGLLRELTCQNPDSYIEACNVILFLLFFRYEHPAV